MNSTWIPIYLVVIQQQNRTSQRNSQVAPEYYKAEITFVHLYQLRAQNIGSITMEINATKCMQYSGLYTNKKEFAVTHNATAEPNARDLHDALSSEQSSYVTFGKMNNVFTYIDLIKVWGTHYIISHVTWLLTCIIYIGSHVTWLLACIIYIGSHVTWLLACIIYIGSHVTWLLTCII